jgi:hypothetical protein
VLIWITPFAGGTAGANGLLTQCWRLLRRSKKLDAGRKLDAGSQLPRSDAATAGEQVEDENDDSQNQEDVNPPSQGVSAHEAQDPKDYKNNGDGPKHDGLSPRRFNGHGLVQLTRFATSLW